MKHFKRLTLTTIIATLVIATLTSTAQAASTRSERLWLPASAAHLRPFLQMAVDLALEDEGCTEVLYARLNEYRTIYEEPTFTILCKRDARSTFNRVVAITEVDPEYFIKLEASEEALDTSRTLSTEIEAIRQQLLSPQGDATTSTPPPSPPVQEDPNDMTIDLDSPTATDQ